MMDGFCIGSYFLILFLLIKVSNLQSRVTRLEMDMQRFMLRVIYGDSSKNDDR